MRSQSSACDEEIVKPGTQERGLCDSCAHQKLVPNTRGSVFSLCLRSRSDARYPRYPRLPVKSCAGYEPPPAPVA